MTLSALRKALKGRYGREYSTSADALFTDDLLTEIINQAHREAAVFARLYRQRRTYDLPVGSNGLSTVELACNVIDLDRDNVRILSGSDWIRLDWRDEQELLDESGPLENTVNGTPGWFFMREGDASEEQRILEIYPGAATAVTNGVAVTQWVYPVLLSADTDTPALQAAEHTRLLNPALLKMAQLDNLRGRDGIAFQRLEQAAFEDLTALKTILQRHRMGGYRKIHYREGAYW